MTPAAPHRFRLPSTRLMMLILVALALLLRFGNMYFTQQSPVFWTPTSDEAEHYAAAVTFSSGDWLGRSIGPFFRPQLFAYVIAVLFAVFGQHFLVTHIFLGLIDSFAVLLWFAVARRCFPRVPAFIGAIFIAIYYPFIHFSGTGYMESFAMALNAALLLALTSTARRYQRRRNPRLMLGLAGVLAGLSVLTRPQMMLLLPILSLALWWIGTRFTKSILKGLAAPMAFGIIALTTMSPNALRHMILFHLWAPIGTASEISFHMSNNRDGWGWEYSSPGIEYEIYQSMPAIEGGVNPTLEHYRAWWSERNRAYLREEPGRYVRGLALKMLQVLNRREVHCTQNFLLLSDLSPIERYAPGFAWLTPTGFAACVAVLATTAIGLRRRQLPADTGTSAQAWSRLLLVFWAGTYLVGVALFLAISRHRLPAMPPLLLLSGYGAWHVVRLVRARDWWMNPWLFGILVAMIVCRLPVIPAWYETHERWWSQVNVGVALIALNRPEEAATTLKAATEIMPEKLETWRQLALAENAAGRPADAIDAQKQLLQLQRTRFPKYYNIEAEIFDKLIEYQIAAGRWSDAESSVRTLDHIVPGHPNVARLQAEIEKAKPGS